MSEILVELHQQEDIYIIVVHKNSRQAVDAYFDLITPQHVAHIQQNGIDAPFMLVLDITQSGMFSLQYASQRMSTFFSQYEKPPILYIAYLTSDMQDKILVEMMNSLTARRMTNTRKVFPANQLNEAIAWLKQASSGA